MFVLTVAAHVILDGTAVPGASDATQRDAHGGGGEGDGLMLSLSQAANHVAETTQRY